MWYDADWVSSYAAVLQFMGAGLSLLGDTLSAMIAEHIFAFFLAFLLLAAVVVGDTTYNIYYIVQSSGGGEVDPSPSPTVPPSEHVHDYVSVVTQEPTCISPGLKTNTCSICGASYPEKIPASGHTWEVHKTVTTEYDENGEVIQIGYTIWICTACGEQYKDVEGTGPPGGGSGLVPGGDGNNSNNHDNEGSWFGNIVISIGDIIGNIFGGGSGGSSGEGGEDDSGGGILEWLGNKLGELLGAIGDGILGLIQTALGKVLDGLIAIVNMISEKLEAVVNTFLDCLDVLPGIFSGFTDFLTAGFAFLPPEVITVITFGILMMVLVAIIKLFLK